MLVRLQGKGTHLLLVGVQIGTTTMEISVEAPQESKIHLPQDPALLFLGIYIKDSILSQRYLLIHVHCSPILNSQKLETV